MARQEWFINKIYGNKIPHVDELTPDSPLRKNAETITSFFDAGVDNLRDYKSFPNKKINKLMTLFWRLVGNQVTPTVLHSSVPRLSFLAEKRGIESMAMIFVPFNYVELCLEDPIMELSALVFNASQARDYYNDKLGSRESIIARAQAYEAEFLRKFKEINPQTEFNDYLSHVVELYPEGLNSLDPKLKYSSLPFKRNN